jgi:sec-independent protein translocase protein TatC
VTDTKPAEPATTTAAEDDDEVEQSRAPLLSHIVELRGRLMKSVIFILIAFVGCFAISGTIYNLLIFPYEWAAGEDAELRLIFTAPQEFLITRIKLAFFGALFLAFPIIATQVYKFAAPGLYKNERKAFLPFLIATPILFLVGTAIVYFVIMPLAMGFFLGMEQTGGDGQAAIELLPRVSEYLSLIMILIFAFGLCFQLPVVLILLARAGIVSASSLKTGRRYAIVGAFVAAAVLTPPDIPSQIGLAIPTILLYELSIWAVRIVERRRAEAEAARAAGASA